MFIGFLKTEKETLSKIMSRMTFLKDSIDSGFITRYGKKGQKVFHVALSPKQQTDFQNELKVLEKKKFAADAEITRLTTEYENKQYY